jgi:uncharacterized protein YggE
MAARRKIKASRHFEPPDPGTMLAAWNETSFYGSENMRRQSCRKIMASWMAIGFLIVVSGAAAQEPLNTISISGRGKIKVAPTTVELSGMISIESELAGDALTKFRTAKQSFSEAIPKLGIPELTMEMGGFSIGPSGMNDSTAQMIINRSRGTAEPPKVTVQESVRLRLKQIDKLDRDKLFELLAKIIDASKESGVTFGPPPGSNRLSIPREDTQSFVTFTIDEPQAAREQADSRAMQDAHVRAERLAKLAGCPLGEVRSIREVARATEYLSSGLRVTIPEQSSKLEEIEITSVLQVDFKMLPPNGQ